MLLHFYGFVFWQPPEQLQSSMHGRLALKHLQRPLKQPFLHPHFSNSRHALEALEVRSRRVSIYRSPLSIQNQTGMFKLVKGRPDACTIKSSVRMIQQGIAINKQKLYINGLNRYNFKTNTHRLFPCTT